MDNDNEENYVALGKAAKIYGVSRTTVLNWIKSEKVRAIKTPGNHYRVDLSEIVGLKNGSRTKEAVGKKKIMIVDDDEVSVQLLKEIIEDNFEDAELIYFHDGYSALLSIVKADPDIVLLDLNMPKMDGFEFARSIYENADTNDIPIIVISAYIDNSARQELNSYNVTHFIDKLHFHEGIVDTIKELTEVKE